jgi:hypothetical protein
MAVINNPQLKWWDGNVWRPKPADIGARFVVAASGTIVAITGGASTVNGGATFTLSGTVKNVSTGANVTNGTVQLEYWNGTVWSTTGAPGAATITAGTFSISTVTETTTRQWRANYVAGAGNTNAISASKTVTRKELVTFVKTYAATASSAYGQSGTKLTGRYITQGYYSAVAGIQKSIICFPYATIVADMTGFVSCTKLEMFLNAVQWGPDSGGTAILCDHNYTTPPAADPLVTISYASFNAWSTKSGSKWCDISTTIGGRLAAGTAKGIALYTQSTSNEYYGYFSGFGDVNPPSLRVTYTKWV